MSNGRSLLLTLLLLCAAGARGRAQDPTASAANPELPHATKFPLRLHVLAIDDTHRTVRMQPNWCAGSLPEVDAESGSSCGGSGSTSLGGGDDDFSGAGRADLVTPPDGTAGVDFTYEGCNRVRVAPGFDGFAARWVKPGARLQVLIPTDALSHGEQVFQRCTLKVKTQEFVYLRMHNGAILRVSQQAYAKKPSLRVFLSGGSETLVRKDAVVSVQTLAGHPRQP